jgi:hypothetical protein
MSIEELERQAWLKVVEQDRARFEAEKKAMHPVLTREVSWRALIGWVLVLGGLGGMGFFLLAFDVSAPGGEVVNLGLMNTRLVGVLVSGFCFLGGLVLVAIGRKA